MALVCEVDIHIRAATDRDEMKYVIAVISGLEFNRLDSCFEARAFLHCYV